MKALTSVKNVRSKANAFTQKKGVKGTTESPSTPPLTLTLKEGGGGEGMGEGGEEEEEHKNGEADTKPATFQEAFGNIFKPKEKKRKMTTAELARVSQQLRGEASPKLSQRGSDSPAPSPKRTSMLASLMSPSSKNVTSTRSLKDVNSAVSVIASGDSTAAGKSTPLEIVEVPYEPPLCTCDAPCLCKEYNIILHKSPNDYFANFGLGVAAQAKNELKMAQEHFRAAIRSSPKDPHAHAHLAQILDIENDVDGAVRHYRAALRAYSEIDKRIREDGALSVMHRDLAECLRLLVQREADAADNVIRTNLEPVVVAAKPHARSPTFSEINETELLSPADLEKLRLEECMRNYNEASLLDPNIRIAHTLRMNYLIQNGRNAEAVVHYTHLVRMRPNDIELQYDLNWILDS